MASLAHEEEEDDGTRPPETPQQQPPIATSLLSLPDELLLRIFDYLAVQLRYRDHPLLPLLSVCRRSRQVVPTILYRDVVLNPHADASQHFWEAVEANPSVGQLISRLEVSGPSTAYRYRENGTLARERAYTTISTLTQLKDLTLIEITTVEANAVLAALPLPSLRSLEVQLKWTTDPAHRQELWTHLSRHSELRVLECGDWCFPSSDRPPRMTAIAAQHLHLPQLLDLHMIDRTLIDTFESTGPLQHTLPNLRILHITITQSDYTADIIPILSGLPSSLKTLKLPDNFGFVTPSWDFAAFPALRHLEFGPGTFLEAELLTYLPTAPMESITFPPCAKVTDGILRFLLAPK